MSKMSCAICILAIGFAIALTGCDRTPPPPKTYPVKGKVAFIGGGNPSGGVIEFRSVSESVTALGQVQSDGSFVLSTLASNQKLDGAVEGEHTVRFTPDMGQGEQSTLLPVTAKEKYRVKTEGDNDLVVTVARPKAP
ncbi:MAG: hypothetical protein HYR84_17080 [Planctomycetes bacterium]|nr:hypothetical protein [Planctomycetota bacterium]